MSEGVLDYWGIANVLPLRWGEDNSVLPGLLAQAQVDHPIGGAVGVRIHDDGVDDAEDGGSGRDTESDGQIAANEKSGLSLN